MSNLIDVAQKINLATQVISYDSESGQFGIEDKAGLIKRLLHTIFGVFSKFFEQTDRKMVYGQIRRLEDEIVGAIQSVDVEIARTVQAVFEKFQAQIARRPINAEIPANEGMNSVSMSFDPFIEATKEKINPQPAQGPKQPTTAANVVPGSSQNPYQFPGFNNPQAGVVAAISTRQPLAAETVTTISEMDRALQEQNNQDGRNLGPGTVAVQTGGLFETRTYRRVKTVQTTTPATDTMDVGGRLAAARAGLKPVDE